MKEIEINLTLRFRMPENGLNVNGILMGLHNVSSKVSFALLKALFSAIEEETIEQMQKKFPSRYIHNGHQRKARELRTSFGSFHYRLAQLYDKVEKRTVVPLRKSSFLPKYRQKRGRFYFLFKITERAWNCFSRNDNRGISLLEMTEQNVILV